MNWAQLLIAVAVIAMIAGWQFGRRHGDFLPCAQLVRALPIFWATPGDYLRMLLLYILAVVSLFLLLTGIVLLLLPGFPWAWLAGLAVTWLVLVTPPFCYGTDCLRGYLQRHVFRPPLPSPAEIQLLEKAGSPLPQLLARFEQGIHPAFFSPMKSPSPGAVSAVPTAPDVACALSSRLRTISQTGKRCEIEALIAPLIKDKGQRERPFAIVRDDGRPDLVQAELLGIFLASLAVVRYAHCCAERGRRAAEVRRFFEPDTESAPARSTTIS